MTEEEPLDPVLELARTAVEAAIEKKGVKPVILDVSEHLRILDYFVIVSAGNRRQVATLVEEIEAKVKATGRSPLRMEGLDQGEWVLLDYGDVVVHVFLDEIREFYDLERLWSDAPRLDVPSSTNAVEG